MSLLSAVLLSALAVLVPSPCAGDGDSLSLAAVPCGERHASPGHQTRIKGGQEAYRGQFPWSVSVRHQGAHLCMGALLSDRYVLTAAHCFGGRPASQFSVLVGGQDLTSDADAEPGRRVVTVERKIIHEDYVEGRFDDDIALLRLSEPVTWGDFVQPVCVPPASADAKRYTGARGLLAGWGYLDEWRTGGERSDTLQWTALPLLSRQTCQQWFTDAGKVIKVRPGKVCAGFREGGTDSCQADSGGSLTVADQDGDQERAVVVGVVSAGIGCGRPGLPGIYTDVTHYHKWIVDHVEP
ncbi:Serine protease 33 [Amphibalanus amphitrite]|uniref:limulus clotting factor C n=1 Tax=Amphibalanus amphitrite TaxID=1232801 RepID=A0A6A4WNZ5_AMPAM|nr:Serine protease 33 [Amphibalanus amphitrite]